MRLVLKDVRLAFPQIWAPAPFPGSPDPTPYYNASFLLGPKHPQLAEIRKIIDEEGEKKWPKNWPAMKKAIEAQGKMCLRDGDTKPEFDGYPGNFFISSRCKASDGAPGIYTIADGKRVKATEMDGKPYGGCYVDAVIEIFAYQNVAKGIAAKLCGIGFVRDGDRFSAGGGAAAADEFGDLGDQGADPALA